MQIIWTWCELRLGGFILHRGLEVLFGLLTMIDLTTLRKSKMFIRNPWCPNCVDEVESSIHIIRDCHFGKGCLVCSCSSNLAR